MSRNRILAIWLCSAVIVTLARVFNAAELGELPIQIQAGQHLFAGKGLTVYSSPGEDDLAQPATLVTLAHYPAGYSIYAAGMLAAGASLPTLAKFYFAITTLLGWWGWGNLAYYFFADGLGRNRVWTWAACIIAACTPLLSTMLWKGTDTFFWAAIPWVFCWITKTAASAFGPRPIGQRPMPRQSVLPESSVEGRLGGRWLDWIAGLLCGLSFFNRYAAIFLIIYAVGVIVCQSLGHPKTLMWRAGAFAAGVVPFLILQFYITLFKSNAEPIPDIFTLQGGAGAILQRALRGIPFLTSANIALVWWMPHWPLEFLTRSARQAPWLLGATMIGWAVVPVFLSRKIGSQRLREASRDVRTVAAGWFVLLPLFLLGWTGLADYIYVLEDRYYLPLIPLVVLIAYALAVPRNDENRLQKWITIGSRVYIAGYVIVAVIATARLLVPGTIGTSSRIRLMGMFPERFHWPSSKLVNEFSEGRTYVLQLLRENPTTVLVTDHEEWFYAEPGIDQSRIRRLKDLRATYVTGPARILIAIRDPAPGALTSVTWFGHYDRRWKADYFEGLSDVRLLREFPKEGIRVVEAMVPTGIKIPLRKDTARLENL